MSSTPSTPSRSVYIVDGKTDAEKYLQDIYDGKIIACSHMRKLSEIMLPRFHEEYHGYHFSADIGTRVCRFVEEFCCFPEGEKMGQPFLLEPFQRAALELAYGFVDENDLRQYRQVLMVLARKNGKTSLLAALCLYHLTSDFPKELGAEIYCCATGESQARKCFAAADNMRRHSPHLAKRVTRGMVQKRGVSGLNYRATESVMVPLSSSVGRLDGLSSSMCCYDEIGAATDGGALLDLIEESTSARRQPMTWLITTNNYVRNNVFDERFNYAKGWLDGSIHDDTFLPMLYMLDSRDEVYDERAWPKANPGLLCGIKDWEYLRNRVNKAKQSPSKMPSVLTKEFNLNSSAYAAYMDINDCVNKDEIDFPIEDIPYAIFGFDLAERGDLCSCVMRFMRPGDNNVYEVARFWLPEASVAINSAKDFKERDKVPYHQWAADGWIDLVDGDRVNNYVIIEFLREMVDRGIYPYAVGYDKWHVEDSLERDLMRLIGQNRCYAVPQTARVISPLMKEHKLDRKAKRVICPSPVLHWNRSCVEARRDNNNNVFAKKIDLGSNRIDGYMSELFSLAAYHRYEEEYISAIGWYPPDEKPGSSK